MTFLAASCDGRISLLQRVRNFFPDCVHEGYFGTEKQRMLSNDRHTLPECSTNYHLVNLSAIPTSLPPELASVAIFVPWIHPNH